MVDDDVEMNDLSMTIDQGLHKETVSDNVEMDKTDRTTNDEDQASNPEEVEYVDYGIGDSSDSSIKHSAKHIKEI
jgi:hypothetical protein